MSKHTAIDVGDILKKHSIWIDYDGEVGEKANLKGADLRGADLRNANLRNANLKGANLWNANLSYANLVGANLKGANLKGADLRNANLKGANLKGADLWSANLSYASLVGANLRKAILIGANLRNANLKGADLKDADIAECNGNMTHIKSVFCEKYEVTYTSEVMQIGCECHSIEDWWEFDNKQILEMDGRDALKFWRVWKPILKQIIEASPAEPTEHKGETK